MIYRSLNDVEWPMAFLKRKGSTSTADNRQMEKSAPGKLNFHPLPVHARFSKEILPNYIAYVASYETIRSGKMHVDWKKTGVNNGQLCSRGHELCSGDEQWNRNHVNAYYPRNKIRF